MAQQKKYASAIILGMHDALVSLTGLLAGLTFALTQKKLIILSAIIASVTAGLSMGASEYLAEKTNHNQYAWRAGIATGIVYMTTCVMLLIPFYILDNSLHNSNLQTLEHSANIILDISENAINSEYVEVEL